MFILILLALLSTIGLLGLEIDGRLSASARELVGDPNPFSAIVGLGGAVGRLSVYAVELGDPNPFSAIVGLLGGAKGHPHYYYLLCPFLIG